MPVEKYDIVFVSITDKTTIGILSHVVPKKKNTSSYSVCNIDVIVHVPSILHPSFLVAMVVYQVH